MTQIYEERHYIDDDYCYSVVQIGNDFSVSICELNEYYESEKPEFVLVDVCDNTDIEKIESIINTDEFKNEAITTYARTLATIRRSKKVNQDIRDEEIVREIKDAIVVSDENDRKLCWTLEEASKYAHIGKPRIDALSLEPDCPWVFWVSQTKRIVKVDEFKKWLRLTKGIE